jgi:hypothetical protein
MVIIQIQYMNLMLNMKDINKILAKTHFKCKYKKKYEKKTPTFLQKHVSEGEVKSPYFLQVW